MPKLTKRVVDDIQPTVSRAISWDSELRGFGLLVLPSGVRSFILQYRTSEGRSRRLTLGRFGVITVDEARKIAREKLVEVANGGDPLGERRSFREAPTMGDLFDRYLVEHVASHNAISTRLGVTALLEKHLRPNLGQIKVASFSRKDASKLHTALRTRPRRANHALAIISKTLSLAEIWGLRPANSNPCRSIPRYPENHRDRFLNGKEVKRLGEVLVEAETVGLPRRLKEPMPDETAPSIQTDRCDPVSWQATAAIRLLLLTGARLSEVLSLKWSGVSQDDATITLPSTKGGKLKPHPVGDDVMRLLGTLPRDESASPYVLPNPKDPSTHVSRDQLEYLWRHIRWRAAFQDVRLHDLRHTVGTYGAQAGVSAFIVRDLLRHTHIGTTSRYANFDMDPVRNISNVVGRRIMESLNGQKRLDDAESDLPNM